MRKLLLLFLFFSFSAKSQVNLSQKLENIKPNSSLHDLVSTFGKKFQIRRDFLHQNLVYELYYREQGFGLLISADEIEKQIFIGTFIYPEHYIDSSFYSIPIKKMKKLKDFKLKDCDLTDIILDDFGTVTKPILTTNNFYKDNLLIELSMPALSTDSFPIVPKGDKSIYENFSCNDCPYFIKLDENNKWKSVFSKRNILGRSISNLEHEKLYYQLMNQNIERLLFVKLDFNSPPPVVEEIKK